MASCTHQITVRPVVFAVRKVDFVYGSKHTHEHTADRLNLKIYALAFFHSLGVFKRGASQEWCVGKDQAKKKNTSS